MHHDMLIVEDLMLLLLHDEHETIAGAGNLHYKLPARGQPAGGGARGYVDESERRLSSDVGMRVVVH